MVMLTPPRPSTPDFLAAAGISVASTGRIWTILSDGREVCWMHSADEAELTAYELATEIIASGLVGEIPAETEYM
jgi:hypothetical protein